MWSYLSHPLIVLFARVVLGLVLLIAGLSKLPNRKEVIQAVANYEILPRFLTRSVGILLPWMELGTAIFLLSGMIPIIAGLFAAILLICFMIAILVNLIRGKDFNCHCFGQLYYEKIGIGVLLQDLVLLSLAIEILFYHLKDNMIKSSTSETLLVIILAGAFVIVFALLQQMRDFFQQIHIPE